MAVSDLTKELEKDTYKPDVASQKRIVAGLVSVVTNDTASEVRSCVIKWCVKARELWAFLARLILHSFIPSRPSQSVPLAILQCPHCEEYFYAL